MSNTHSEIKAYLTSEEAKGDMFINWEEKRIRLVDIISDDIDVVLEPYRDWMLGGKNMEWRYRKDGFTGDIILERR